MTHEVVAAGPIIDVTINLSAARLDAMRAANVPLPQPRTARALIDTGASCTCVDPSVLEALGAEARTSIPMRTPPTGMTPATVLQYDVSIRIDHPTAPFAKEFTAVPVAAVALGSRDVTFCSAATF